VNTAYLPGFIRDLKALKKTPVFDLIKTLVFEEIPGYENLEQISHLKKLKGDTNAYRIRVGDYRIGIFLQNDVVTFARVQHRRDIYRYFP
jgi:mRNA-degrading endonuclease RelE of RelBE toxin-antitoxin system